mmetsp:Transcript_17942/g.28072  ORF Transcript_17942/g.28072 Transcript_17942/m.28072 type:complete len:391 (-) Transcript_17942:52-1224(-)
MKSLFIVIAFSLFVSLIAIEEDTEQELKKDNMKVVAYVPEYRLHAISWESVGPLITHAILFSLEMHPSGELKATDRLPDAENLEILQEIRKSTGMKVLIGFGGNGRSDGFAPMTTNGESRKKFVSHVVELVEKYELDGVDYNWEYPGFRFGQGYLPRDQIKAEFLGLERLVKDTRDAFNQLSRPMEITLAYYPDGQQERLYKQHGILRHADLAHAMAYDQNGGEMGHSPLSLVQTVIGNAKAARLDLKKITVGVPFYGRDERTGHAETYEDIVHADPDGAARGKDVIVNGRVMKYNSPRMIEKKTIMALEGGLGGVMIWELGQDCRLKEVTRGGRTHAKTCPRQTSSLLFAIKMGRKQYRLETKKRERATQMAEEVERKLEMQKKKKDEL